MNTLLVNKTLHELECAREDLKLAKRYEHLLITGVGISMAVVGVSTLLCWLLTGYFAVTASFAFITAVILTTWAAYVKTEYIEPARKVLRQADWNYQEALLAPTPQEKEVLRLNTVAEPEVLPALTTGKPYASRADEYQEEKAALDKRYQKMVREYRVGGMDSQTAQRMVYDYYEDDYEELKRKYRV